MKVGNIWKRMKSMVSPSSSFSVVFGGTEFSATSYRTYVREGYQKNPVLFAGIDYIAKAVSGLKWVLYNDDENNANRKLIENHPLIKLAQRPDPRLSRGEFYRRLVLHMYFEGDCFTFMNAPNNGKGQPKELNILRPDRVKIKGNTVFYTPSTGQEIKYELDNVIQIMFYDPLDDVNGTSPIRAAAESVELNNSYRKWDIASVKNSTRFSTWFTSASGLSEDQTETLKKLIEERYAGPDNADRPVVLKGDLDLKHGNFSPKDMDFLAGLLQSAREICQVLHIPPELIGDSEGRTYSNYETARKSFYDETVIPIGNMIRDAFNLKLATRFGDSLYLDFDKSVINALQEEVEKKDKRVSTRYQSGIITLDEARADLGLPQLKPGDEERLYQLPSGMSGAGDFGLVDDTEPKSKVFTVQFKARRRQRYQIVDGYRKRFQGYMLGLAEDQLAQEGKAIVARVRKSTPAMAGQLVDELVREEFSRQWKEILTKFSIRVISTIGKQEFESLLDLGKGMRHPAKRTDFDPYSDAINRQVQLVVASKVQMIGQVTARTIKRQIQDGIEEGLSIDAIADKLNELYDVQIVPHRAERIARTETISTTNFAGHEVAKQTGLNLKKEWISTLDGRTRGADPDDEFDHIAMNGKVQELSVAWMVNSEKLMFPGDSSLGASAGNVIQCRCAEAYVPVDEQ